MSEWQFVVYYDYKAQSTAVSPDRLLKISLGKAFDLAAKSHAGTSNSALDPYSFGARVRWRAARNQAQADLRTGFPVKIRIIRTEVSQPPRRQIIAPMHYYQHHIGDYRRDTGALSLAEHGAYRLLMDEYYVTDRPLPVDLNALWRICGAMIASEKKAVASVVQKFFRNEDGVLKHKRIDEELVRFKGEIELKSKGGKASALKRAQLKEQQNGKFCSTPVGTPLATADQHGPQQDGNMEPTNQEPTTNNHINAPKPPKGARTRKPRDEDQEPADPRYKEFMAEWDDRYNEFHGYRYSFAQASRDGKELKMLLASSKDMTVGEIVDIAQQAWSRHQEKGDFAKACKASAAIHSFCVSYNSIRSELKAADSSPVIRPQTRDSRPGMRL